MDVIGALPARGARLHPGKAATIFREETLSFAAFADQVNRCAHVLRGLGVGRGDHVAVLCRNRPEALIAAFATARLGAVHLPVNFRLSASEASFILADAGAGALLAADDFAEVVDGLDPRPERIVSIDRELPALLAAAPAEPISADVSPDDPFAVFYTSGSTGLPKGAVLTHRNFLAGVVNHVIAYGLAPDDVCLHIMPLYHTMEASMAMCQFALAGTNVIVESFDPTAFWELVDAHGVTHVTLVHTMLSDVLDVAESQGRGRGTLRSLSAGGQAVPTDVIRRTHRVLGPDLLFVVYGLTEASPLLTHLSKRELDAGLDDDARLQSVGRELFHCEVRIVDEADRDVAVGEVGEIVARGANVMAGYHRRPDETAAALRGGWLRTGDMGRFDADGFLSIVDRKKDLIISGGENIAPREVEDVLYRHPAVVECCVVGVPDERWGEAVLGVVALREPCDEQELIAHCRERLARYKCPRHIVVRDKLPRDPVGKLQRRIVRDEYLAAR